MDEIFRLLSHVDRRRLLVALLDHDPQRDEPISVLDDLQVGDRDERRFQVAMVHSHLPLLEDAAVVMWDRDSHEVLAGPRFEDVRPLLELLDEHAADLPGEWV